MDMLGSFLIKEPGRLIKMCGTSEGRLARRGRIDARSPWRCTPYDGVHLEDEEPAGPKGSATEDAVSFVAQCLLSLGRCYMSSRSWKRAACASVLFWQRTHMRATLYIAARCDLAQVARVAGQAIAGISCSIESSQMV